MTSELGPSLRILDSTRSAEQYREEMSRFMENKVPELIEEREKRLALAEEDVPALLTRKTIHITSTERELIELQLKNLRAMRFEPDETNDRVGIFALSDLDGSEEEMVVYLGTTNEGEPAVLGGVMRRPNQEG